MNAAAGVGGPAVSRYAVGTGWTAREFLPDARLCGAVVNAFSLAGKGLPTLSRPARWPVAAARAGGTVVGRLLAALVPEHRARRVVPGPAPAGGVTTLVKGVSGLGRTPGGSTAARDPAEAGTHRTLRTPPDEPDTLADTDSSGHPGQFRNHPNSPPRT
ncbi:hypothetical protein [Kitasatospora sp. NPDC096204]|uniref:hypothetical protein n=1 Tax=Kitasatospora sp. NPDC096204 TaxID=3364094 RepID=UPI0038008CCA